MDVNSRNIVTTSGASVPQRSAGASGSGKKTGSHVAGSFRSLSNNREGAGVASQAPATLPTTRAVDEHDAYDMGPFSCIDEVEVVMLEIRKLADRLKKFCADNRNVHQPIKAMAVELHAGVGRLDPALAMLRRSTAAVDREVRDLSTSIRLASFNDSMMGGTSSPKKKKTAEASNQTDAPAPHVPPPPLPQRGEAWTKVGAKKPKPPKKSEEGNAQTKAPLPRKKQRRQHIPRPKNEAILVELEGKSNEEKKPAAKAAAEALKAGVDLCAHQSISPRLRITRAGDLLIEAGKGQTVPADFLGALVGCLDGLGSVRRLEERATIEVLDIDPTASVDEIGRAINAKCGDPGLKMGRVSAARSGMQKATATVSRKKAEELTGEKLKIGWSLCRVRLKPKNDRCFRCHLFGHIASKCDGPDRSKLCMRCGSTGHTARSCSTEARCLPCEESGQQDARHEVGSQACKSRRR